MKLSDQNLSDKIDHINSRIENLDKLGASLTEINSQGRYIKEAERFAECEKSITEVNQEIELIIFNSNKKDIMAIHEISNRNNSIRDLRIAEKRLLKTMLELEIKKKIFEETNSLKQEHKLNQIEGRIYSDELGYALVSHNAKTTQEKNRAIVSKLNEIIQQKEVKLSELKRLSEAILNLNSSLKQKKLNIDIKATSSTVANCVKAPPEISKSRNNSISLSSCPYYDPKITELKTQISMRKACISEYIVKTNRVNSNTQKNARVLSLSSIIILAVLTLFWIIIISSISSILH